MLFRSSGTKHILWSYDATEDAGGLSAGLGDTYPMPGLGCATVIGLIMGCKGGVVLFGKYGDVMVGGIVIDIGSSMGVFWEDGCTGTGLSAMSIPP